MDWMDVYPLHFYDYTLSLAQACPTISSLFLAQSLVPELHDNTADVDRGSVTDCDTVIV